MILGQDGRTAVSIKIQAKVWLEFKAKAILMQRMKPDLKINDVVEMAIKEYTKKKEVTYE